MERIFSLNQLVAIDDIAQRIYTVRGVKVMLDRDLAELYEAETKVLKRNVRRNIDRFPQDFMFELTPDEFQNLRSQIDTSSWGSTRYMPMAFTEHGVAMDVIARLCWTHRPRTDPERLIRTLKIQGDCLAAYADSVSRRHRCV